MPFRSHDTEIASVRITYDAYEGAGLPVVLLHGSGASRRMWRETAEAMATRGLRAFAPDLPGHGDSGWLDDGGYGPAFFARVIIAFVRHVGAAEGLLVGHSLGGHLALEALAGLRELRGLAICGAPPLASTADAARAFLPGAVTRLMFQQTFDDDDVLAWSDAFPPTDPARIREDLLRADGRVRVDMGAALAKGELMDEVAALRDSHPATLVIHGTLDRLVSLHYLRSLDLGSLGATLHIIEEAGHFAAIDQPEKFSSAVAGLPKRPH